MPLIKRNAIENIKDAITGWLYVEKLHSKINDV
jgi:hypothetical protein